MAVSFYCQLYTKENRISNVGKHWHLPKLGRSSIWWLNRGVTEYEIRVSLFQLGAHKAPSPDGLPAYFFQRFWLWVGEAVTRGVQKIFESTLVPTHFNQSLICLIPKMENSEHISQFRPIRLSNVVIKIVFKVLANRLKLLMNELVGHSQASFIHERQTTDNIIVRQELIHSLR